ncbi:MAG: hypothetical protein QXT40_03595 [Candidatus Micrarchaeia archaeon]
MLNINDELGAWIKEKLTQKVEEKEIYLLQNKEKVIQALNLSPDGKVILLKTDLSAKLKILLCYIGAAYAKRGGLREEDSVSNSEIYEWTLLPKGTVKPIIKKLKEEHYIIPDKKEGVYVIDYRKIGEILDEVLGKG